MTFSGLGAALPGLGSTRSRTSEPVRTGTPLAADLLCQPRALLSGCAPNSGGVQLSGFAGRQLPCTASLAFILRTSQSFQLPGACQLGGLVMARGVERAAGMNVHREQG